MVAGTIVETFSIEDSNDDSGSVDVCRSPSSENELSTKEESAMKSGVGFDSAGVDVADRIAVY